MHPIQARPVSRLVLATHSAIGGLQALLAAMLGRGTRTQHTTSDYEGYAWCDSMESQLNNDIAIYRRARHRRDDRLPYTAMRKP